MLKEPRKKELLKFIGDLELNINDLNLLNVALTHGSYVKENPKLKVHDNERLEFFGDAVLKLYISDYIMNKFQSYSEGELSILRAFIVSEKVLTQIAKKLNLKKYLLLGKNEKKNLPDSIQADSLEALLAVIYYICGPESTKKFIFEHWKEHIKYASESKGSENFKAMLQEFTQGKGMGLPEYNTIAEKGPDHKKEFEVAVYLLGKEMARGRGKNKKEASQDAARNALNKINKTS